MMSLIWCCHYWYCVNTRTSSKIQGTTRFGWIITEYTYKIIPFLIKISRKETFSFSTNHDVLIILILMVVISGRVRHTNAYWYSNTPPPFSQTVRQLPNALQLTYPRREYSFKSSISDERNIEYSNLFHISSLMSLCCLFAHLKRHIMFFLFISALVTLNTKKYEVASD